MALLIAWANEKRAAREAQTAASTSGFGPLFVFVIGLVGLFIVCSVVVFLELYFVDSGE